MEGHALSSDYRLAKYFPKERFVLDSAELGLACESGRLNQTH